MTQNVSVPEKTLEHWASLCVAYRYRSLAAQWWPVNGVDIDLQALPAQPGKAIQLEVAGVLRQDLNAHRRRDRGVPRCLVQFDISDPDKAEWGIPLPRYLLRRYSTGPGSGPSSMNAGGTSGRS